MGIRDGLHLGHREPKQAPDPNHPHEFRRLSDNWLGHGVAPARGPGGVDAQIVGAAMQFTGQQCGICRRLPDDPIHEVAEG